MTSTRKISLRAWQIITLFVLWLASMFLPATVKQQKLQQTVDIQQAKANYFYFLMHEAFIEGLVLLVLIAFALILYLMRKKTVTYWSFAGLVYYVYAFVIRQLLNLSWDGRGFSLATGGWHYFGWSYLAILLLGLLFMLALHFYLLENRRASFDIHLDLASGYLPDQYGKHAPESAKYKGQPVVSFPIRLTGLPKDASFVALSLVDYDAVPVAGFPWIHWLVANIPVVNGRVDLPEDYSRLAEDIVQGQNSNASFFVGEKDKAISQRYVGPTPPDKAHRYRLVVTAFPYKIGLKEGFHWNELLRSEEDLGIARAEIDFWGRS
ncbi:YbhB/YbcL family Raf kinase inhibitor-like protein [Lactococcus termiticola]|uniref:Phosphatidylethanolamine-binding protein n=1 Tax=Lactococcus termiticola TaxID=2169526 RepID=A0A2R5HHH9_9LACT|nr:YbhB/YbcL family Raf kinase inhibitor-like protein [Lactococcus termiticola]GBG96805.1 phosphatidylethanolamine-binding protein [Lactococcus termiticola]